MCELCVRKTVLSARLLSLHWHVPLHPSPLSPRQHLRSLPAFIILPYSPPSASAFSLPTSVLIFLSTQPEKESLDLISSISEIYKSRAKAAQLAELVESNQSLHLDLL